MHLGIFAALDYHPGRSGTPAAFFRQILLRAEQAEALAFESFWVSEHHFSTYGLGPDPAVLLTAIAEHTHRLRLGTAVATLPFHHPLRVAETFAMVDQLSVGRLEFGVGSGYLAHEFNGFNIPAVEARPRLDEALEIVRLAWSGRAIQYKGTFFQFDAPPLNLLPLQPGGPPIHLAVTRPASAEFVGRRGYHIAHIPYIGQSSMDGLRSMVAAYRAALPFPAQVSIACHAFCGEESWSGPGDPAYAEVEEALDLYLRTRVVPGARYEGTPISTDFMLFGDVAQWQHYREVFEQIGVDRLLLIVDFGALPDAAVRASLERLATAR